MMSEADRPYRLIPLTQVEAFSQIGLYLVSSDEGKYVMGNIVIQILGDENMKVIRSLGESPADSTIAAETAQFSHVVKAQEYILSVVGRTVLVRKKVPIITHS